MSAERADPRALRVLVLPPAGGPDADILLQAIEQAGARAVRCAGADELCRAISQGAGAL